jgi:D-alanine-D-alanine ligase-like ATP-grasp enzyme
MSELPPAAEPTVPVAHPHYPFITRLLIDLYGAGELPEIVRLDLEPEYGCAGRIVRRDGSARLFRGINFDINPASCSDVTRDKGYTKHFLRMLGYRVPRGKVFLLPAYAAAIDRKLGRYGLDDYATVDQIDAYIDAETGYPCFLKPVTGAQGRGVSRCNDVQEVRAVLSQFQDTRERMVLVEQAVPWPDYRVVVLQDAVLAAYRRRPLVLTGDGQTTIRGLLERRRAELIDQGRRSLRLRLDDPRLAAQLQRRGMTFETVLAAEGEWPVFEAANLSLGGECEDVTDELHEHWRRLCVAIVQDSGLRLCGVDLACADLHDPDAPYGILELNAAPGLAHYAASGATAAARVRGLYRRVFRETIFL